ncbi:class I adenylate-forming enzyme family protein [Pseudahrensia aquimaris]|uniref:Class I adenylate-forming enzyme family protein n=1 Tax=Pseudahrensia aquimaris TaxID=744461 RepID=A0ABW3FDH3_9HYPH
MNKHIDARLNEFLLRQTAERPQAIGWHFEQEGLVSFETMSGIVERYAKWLAQIGVRGGDRVMLVAENSLQIVAAALATWQLHAWIMPVNARLSAGEIDRLAQHARPRCVLFTVQVSKEAAQHAERLGAVEGGLMPHVLVADAGAEPVKARAEEQVAALMYTTGTTGSPKGVMLSHANLAWYAAVTRDFRRLSPADRTYCALPLTHIYGFASAFLGSLHAGARLDVAGRFDPNATLDAIEGGTTVLPAVPAMYAHLLDAAQARGIENLHNKPLRYIMTGGAPLDVDWKRRVESFFNLPLHNGYGMTECAPGIASSKNMRIETSAQDISCGHPLPDLDVRVVPQPGADALNDGVGEIVVKGPNIMLGYFRNAEETSKVMDADGTFHTGDLGRFDEEGRLHLVGRCKELIIRSGFNVYPPEVEQAITRHPGVTLSAVVGRAVQGNEEVIAFVQKVPNSDVTESELQDFLRDDLAPYKRPSRIVVADALPASSTGKILKSTLLEAFADRL